MPEKRTIYHKENGAAEMDAIDANRALVMHGDEWASEPWDKKAAKDAAKATPADEPVLAQVPAPGSPKPPAPKDPLDHDGDGKKADGKKF